MNPFHRWIRVCTRLAFSALLLAVVAGTASAQPMPATDRVGSLQVEQFGTHGQPVILIPGLQGGTWVWKDTIAKLQAKHVVYAVTLAGFNGVSLPREAGNLFDQANASLLTLITTRHLEKPVLVGHSLGGTLALRFAGEHAKLLGGVVAVDGLPIFPGMERVDAPTRQAMAQRTQAQMAALSSEQFAAQALDYMRKVGVIDPQLAARLAPLNARSDIAASAQYMAEDLAFDGRAVLKHADVPVLEISPYYAADFSQPPLVMSEAQKTAYYQGLLSNAPQAKVVSISSSRHYVMFDQPQRFHAVLADFLQSL